jgi:hypothetical protein
MVLVPYLIQLDKSSNASSTVMVMSSHRISGMRVRRIKRRIFYLFDSNFEIA